jgi:hypothetical protein
MTNAEIVTLAPGAVAYHSDFLAYLALAADVEVFAAIRAHDHLAELGWVGLPDDDSADGLLHAGVEDVAGGTVTVWVLPTAPEGIDDVEPWHEAHEALDLAVLGV